MQKGKVNPILGHVMAIATLIVWSTTFVSTKVLLRNFTPIEILFFRFIIAVAALYILMPKRFKSQDKKHELYFAGAGFAVVILYFLFENIALNYTSVSNVGVIISVAPIFTLLLSRVFIPGIRLHANFFIGFTAAIAGIFLISFGGDSLVVSPIGDALAVFAAAGWAVYSVFLQKIGRYGYNPIQVTRRVFTYGVLFMVPALFFLPFRLDLQRFANPVNLLNMLYLGLGASAACFIVWNLSIAIIGPIKANTYIYASPVFTVLFSALLLGERITPAIAGGIILTLTGLLISQRRPAKDKVKIIAEQAENESAL